MPRHSRKEATRGRPGAVPIFEAMEPRLMLDAADIVINEIMYHPGYGRIGDPDYVAEDLAEDRAGLGHAAERIVHRSCVTRGSDVSPLARGAARRHAIPGGFQGLDAHSRNDLAR